MHTLVRTWRSLLLASAILASGQAVAQSGSDPGTPPKPMTHPSFTCRDGMDPVETAICTDEALAAADVELAGVYRSMVEKATPDQRDGWVADQRAWLKKRASMCYSNTTQNPGCLRRQYAARIKQLNQRADELGIRAQLAEGQAAALGISTMSCGANAVDMTFVEDENIGPPKDIPGKLVVVGESGALETRLADCHMHDGTSVRIKTGYEYPADSTGMCGAVPSRQLSVWVDRRRVISGLQYAQICSANLLASLVVTRTGATICQREGQQSPPQMDTIAPAEKGLCKHVAFDPALPVDGDEFPLGAHKVPLVGSFVLHAEGSIASLCSTMMPKGAGDSIDLPDSLDRPVWTAITVQPVKPNQELLGYNATTMSENEDLEVATFDLFNSGKSVTVFRAQSYGHWFNGTALATDREGILAAPFDAHDWEKSVPQGIYPFTYQHAQVFFYGQRTYLLLSPVNNQTATTVVSLRETGEPKEECVFTPVKAHF